LTLKTARQKVTDTELARVSTVRVLDTEATSPTGRNDHQTEPTSPTCAAAIGAGSADAS
jgi:hypothetical protein